jgi:hypothetical protein
VRLLNEMGYTQVDDFTGGMQVWQEAALPIESGTGKPIEPPVVPRVPAPAHRERGRALVDLFERRSTADLVILWFGTIFACAVLYWLLSKTPIGGLREGSGPIDGGLHGLLTALYFSFVTATSVGFGDVTPLGSIRALAIAEAVVGLLVFGAVVSKLVSRKQEQVVSEIHRIAFEDRLERVQTDLHFVLMELQTIANQCKTPGIARQQVRARLESAVAICLAELRTIHDLLYRPQASPEESVLEGILASLATVLHELRELLRCITFEKGAYLTKNLRGVSEYAEEICSDCVPRRYAAHLREWMDTIKATALELK